MGEIVVIFGLSFTTGSSFRTQRSGDAERFECAPYIFASKNYGVTTSILFEVIGCHFANHFFFSTAFHAFSKIFANPPFAITLLLVMIGSRTTLNAKIIPIISSVKYR